MRSLTFLLAGVLGLVPALSVASTSFHSTPDDIAVDRLPVFSSLDGPFVLTTQDGFNVILKFQDALGSFIPVISRSRVQLPEFKLKNGNLTSADESLKSFYVPGLPTFPPRLLALSFSKRVLPDFAADFVAVTRTESGKDVLQLFPLNGPLVVRQLAEGDPILVKPSQNIDPTVQINLTIKPVKSKYNSVNCKDIEANEEYIELK